MSGGSTGEKIKHNLTAKCNDSESSIKLKTKQGRHNNRIDKKLVSNK